MDILLNEVTCMCRKFRFDWCVYIFFWVDGKMTVGISSEIERTYPNYITIENPYQWNGIIIHILMWPFVRSLMAMRYDGTCWILSYVSAASAFGLVQRNEPNDKLKINFRNWFMLWQQIFWPFSVCLANWIELKRLINDERCQRAQHNANKYNEIAIQEE